MRPIRARGILIHFDLLNKPDKPMNLIDLIVSPAYAQAAAAQPNPLSPLIMLAVFALVFYFFLIRPQMKRAKEHREMVSKLAKGDEVVAAGGLLGRVDDLSEGFITLEIADGVKIKLQRHAVTAVLPKGTLKSA
jgi:preprotein translocase subunit YajC